MKHSILTASLCALLSASANAEGQLENLHKDTVIMESILATSLKQNSRREGIRFRRIDTGYLSGQGLVFEIQTSSSGNMQFNFDFSEMLEGFENFSEHFSHTLPPSPPLPDLHEKGKIFSFSFDSDDMEDRHEEAREQERAERRESRERWRMLRDQARDVKWEKRELERGVRDIEFAMRHADSDSKKKLEKDLKELNDTLQSLEQKETEYSRLAAELEEKEKQRKAEVDAEKIKQVQRFLADFEAVVADTLCDYGSGLKSLPDNEKVNFVLKDFVRGENNKSRNRLDKVYVFDMKSVRDCVVEKTTPNDLLVNAKTYVF